jgi:transposase
MVTFDYFLKNLFPFKGYKVYVFKSEEDVNLRLVSRRKCGFCPNCNKRCSNVETEYERTVRDLDLAHKKCYLTFFEKKIQCTCGYRGLEKTDIAGKFSRVTKRMAVYTASLCEKMTLKDVSTITGLDWKTVKAIDISAIKATLPDINKLVIRRIAIDEIAIMKGHKYLSILRDYDTGATIKIIIGRAYAEVYEGLNSLGKERLEKIEYASLDMWDPFIKAITELCPNVNLVFDKFHVVKKVNEALDAVRKKEFAKASEAERKEMKHKRFIILSREKNLQKKEKEELNTLMKQNENLYKGYLLKEQILNIFDDKQSTFEQIKERIDTWLSNILSNQMEEFYKVLNTIKNYMYGILNYFRYGMTNAIAEGFNTKINIIKRRAYGISDVEYFMLKIYQSTGKRLS